VTRRAVRWWLLPLLAVATLVACGGATPSAPVASLLPSASSPVLGQAELTVCDGTVQMRDGVTHLRQVRLRRGAADQLGVALDIVVEGQRLVTDAATTRMRTRVRTLGFAVSNMVIAVEDVRTTDRIDAAASNLRRRTTALRRAIDSFRDWVGCPAPGGTNEADGTTAPGSTGPPPTAAA
jgi:hypothetical protein